MVIFNKIKYQIKDVKTHKDVRGWLAEMVKKSEFKNIPSSFFPKRKKNLEIKQVVVASINPGHTRGNHYHLKRLEWSLVINGNAEYYLEDLKTKKRTKIKVSSKRPKVITIFPGTAHAVKNTSQKIIYIVEAKNNIYNPKKPDSVFYKVI